MSEWQPIETAPKDGTKIDLWVDVKTIAGEPREGQRFTDCWWKEQWMCIDPDNQTPEPVEHYGNYVWRATHWMLVKPLSDTGKHGR